MAQRSVGIAMNGVTGRMGRNQHLERSILAIRRQGGLDLGNGDVLWPEPILVGRDAGRLRALAAASGVERWTTDLDEALALLHLAEAAGVRHGVVQDKLFLPGLVKLKRAIDDGALGRILSVRGEFGYWVFEGDRQAAQRPSWNYRREQGGGIVLDMLPHWRYVLDHLFGEVRAVSCLAVTHIPERVDEQGRRYAATADDAAYAAFTLEGGVVATINASWSVRVHRDELLSLQVDGTEGSAVAGLRECRVQHRSVTPKPVWNPDAPSPYDFRAGWTPVPDNGPFENAFLAQWSLFLRHVALGTPYRHTLREGAKGVQLAELALASTKAGRWIDVPALAP